MEANHMPRRLFPLATIFLSALIGCHGTGTNRPVDNDPLVGGGTLPKAGSPAPTETARNGDIPPIPPATTTSSPAALTQGSLTAGGKGASGSEGVTLGGPRSSDGKSPTSPQGTSSGSRMSPPPESGTAPAVTGFRTEGGDYEGLQQRLQARGVVWQQLRMTGKNEWHFMCAVPDPQQPNVRRNYEAKAAGPNGTTAMRLVLDEIEQEGK